MALAPISSAHTTGVAALCRTAANRIELHGPLTFATIAALQEQVRRAIDSAADETNEINVQLPGVTVCDSAGLALLVECQNLARRRRTAIRFADPPERLRLIARACGLEPLLFPVDTPAFTENHG